MSRLESSVAALLMLSTPAFAQGTQQTTGQPAGWGYGRAEPIGRSAPPMPTPRLGSSPFQNPLGQSIPPATSATNQFGNGLVAPPRVATTPSGRR